MRDSTNTISNAFQTFMTETPQHAQAWDSMVHDYARALVCMGERSINAQFARVFHARGEETEIKNMLHTT